MLKESDDMVESCFHQQKKKKEGKRMPLCTLVQLLLQGLLIENQIFIELFSTEYRTSIAFHKRKMKLFFEDKF